MATTLVEAKILTRLLGSKTSTKTRAAGWWLATLTSVTDCGTPLLQGSNGLHVVETVSGSNLLLLNDGSITPIGHSGQRSTAIDLTMVTPDLHYEAHWSTGVDHLQSDHLPLHLVLGEADPVLAETDRAPVPVPKSKLAAVPVGPK